MNEWILCVITKSDFNFYFCNFIPRGALSVITHSSVSMKLCNFNLQPQFHELIFTMCKQLLGFNFHTCRVALEQNFIALSQVTFMCVVGFTCCSQAVTDSMLKEIWIQILVKTIGKLNVGLLPLCLIRQQQQPSIFPDYSKACVTTATEPLLLLSVL